MLGPVKYLVIPASVVLILVIAVPANTNRYDGIGSGISGSIPKKGQMEGQHGGNGVPPPKKHRVKPGYDPIEHELWHEQHKGQGQGHGHGQGQGHDDMSGSGDIAWTDGLPTPAVSTTPQPDWDYICYYLCQTGDGGLACDCDLLPVGK